jgi:hypothetical protein
LYFYEIPIVATEKQGKAFYSNTTSTPMMR